MASYSVVQYVPNIIANERINIGVIVFDESSVHLSFLKQWARVKAFAKQDITPVRQVVDELRLAANQASELPFEHSARLTPESITQIASRWGGIVQITPPRPSTFTTDRLIESVSRDYLPTFVVAARNYVNRKSVSSDVRKRVEKTFERHMTHRDVSRFVKSDYALEGASSWSHTFNNAIVNERPRMAIQCASFRLPEGTHLQGTLKDICLSIKDAKERHGDIKFGVVLLPPNSDSPSEFRSLHKQTIAVCKKLGATVLKSSDIDDWTEPVAKELAAHLDV